MTETAADAYDRGVTAGEIAARLAGHDQHFDAINGHLAAIANEMHTLRLGVQHLGDQAEANAKTVITTAAALKAADEARRDKATASWSPWQKLFAVIGGAAALAGLIAAINALIN